MLSQELKSRRTNRRSTLAPYEKAKKDYQALSKLSVRRGRKRAALEEKLIAIKESIATVSERLDVMFEEEQEGKTSKERYKQLSVAINRSLNLANTMQDICKEMRQLEEKERWATAKKNLGALGTQLVDQIEEHERTTQSWMKIQFNIDMTTTGTGVAKLPGSIAYSPFTVHDPPFDHIDARNAALTSKSSK